MHIKSTSNFRELVPEHAYVRSLGTGFQFTEGPIWNKATQVLWFNDIPANERWSWSRVHGFQRILTPTFKGNGMTMDGDGNLLVCEHATSLVVRIQHNTERRIVASHYKGKQLNSPNDVVVDKHGNIYFTDSTFGRTAAFGIERPQELAFQATYIAGPDGSLTILADDFEQPNGLCFSPDENRLYVNDSTKAQIRVFQRTGPNTFDSGTIFFNHIGSGTIEEGFPDGMKCDSKGNVYVTGPGGIWVIDSSANLLGRIEVPEIIGNMNWGGSDWQTLFICATSSVYFITLEVDGHQEPYMLGK